MKIVFMGTPDFSVPCLKILLENRFDIVAVVTAPDKPAGRGLKLTTSPVKEFAVAHNLKVLQPLKLKDELFTQELNILQPDLSIVVAFRMLPEIVWSLPKYGCINLHASILPKYRGAAPINWAIINGENETGVSTFFIEKAIDTGNIIYTEKVAIEKNDTAGTMHDKLMDIGAALILKTVQAVAANDYPQVPQNLRIEQPAAPKIYKETCKINWQQPAENIYNFIRGLSPYPAAWTILDNKILKIYYAEISAETATQKASTIETDNKTFIKVCAADYCLNILEVQLEGKKKMKVDEFLRGYKIQELAFQL